MTYSNNKQLQDLDLYNLKKQLYMFIGAIRLINIDDNEIIKDMNKAIYLQVNRWAANPEDVLYTNTDIFLIAVIRIILDLKLNSTPINTKILGLTNYLRTNLVALIEEYNLGYLIYDTNDNVINKDQLIKLINKVCDGETLITEEKNLNQMLILK